MTTVDATSRGRVASMWTEAGIDFRSNVCRVNDVIGLHAHSYDHVSIVTAGWFLVEEIAPDGTRQAYQLAAKEFRTDDPRFDPVGYRITILAWHRHEFRCLGGDPAEVLCLWPNGDEEQTRGGDSC